MVAVSSNSSLGSVCCYIFSLQDADTVMAFFGNIKSKQDETPPIKIQVDKDSLEKKRDNIPKVEIKEHLLKRPRQDKQKLILVWKKLHGSFTGFNMENCPVDNCETTFNKSKLNESDVIVFSGRFPAKFPAYRPKSQIWIYQNMESQVSKTF